MPRVRHPMRDRPPPDVDRGSGLWFTLGGSHGRGALSALIIAALVVVVAPFAGSAAFLLFLFDGLLTKALRGKGD